MYLYVPIYNFLDISNKWTCFFRASAYHATFASQSLEGSLQFESENAVHVISQESLVGAQKFVKGLGRHGKFNVTPMAEPEDWEKEHAEMQKEATAKDTDKEKMS